MNLTPIKSLLVIDTTVYAVDHAGKLNFMVQCNTEHHAMLTVGALAEYHKKLDEVYVFNGTKMEVEKIDLKED